MPLGSNDALARAIEANARHHKPTLDATITALAGLVGARVEGIENSVKSVTSIKSKLDRSTSGRTYVNDSLRYTLLLRQSTYIHDFYRFVRTAVNAPHQMKEVRRRNAWQDGDHAGGGYKGLNCVFIKKNIFEQGGGSDLLLIEVQFHVLESYKAVKKMHTSYELARELPEDHEDAARLEEIARSAFDNVSRVQCDWLEYDQIPNMQWGEVGGATQLQASGRQGPPARPLPARPRVGSLRSAPPVGRPLPPAR